MIENYLQEPYLKEYAHITCFLQFYQLNFCLPSLFNLVLRLFLCSLMGIHLSLHVLPALMYSEHTGCIIIYLYKHFDAMLALSPISFFFNIINTDNFLFSTLSSWFVMKLVYCEAGLKIEILLFNTILQRQGKYLEIGSVCNRTIFPT